MNQDNNLDVEATLNQTPIGYQVHAEQAHNLKPYQADELPSRVSKMPTETDAIPDEIEEYIFSSEEDFEDNDDDDAIEDIRSHISLSSDDPPVDDHGIDRRPWLHMNRQQRREYESMFLLITHPAVGQSWSYTEEYQLQIDKMMLLYIQDFPLSTWVHGQEAAEKAFHFQRERTRWRQLGIRIYGAERLPDIFHPRTSYQAPPPAAQPMPPPPSSNDLPPQVVHQRPAPAPTAQTPSQATPAADPANPPKSSRRIVYEQLEERLEALINDRRWPNLSKEAMKTGDAFELMEKQMEEMINKRVPELFSSDPAKPTQTHAHPPRPRPHQTPSKTNVKAAQKYV